MTTPQQQPPDTTRAILEHLATHGVVDKDQAGSASAGKKHGHPDRSAFPQRLDLHGMTAAQGLVALRTAIERGLHTGASTLLVIHGWGSRTKSPQGPVLKKMVHDVLENELSGRIAGYRPAPLEHGGAGATIVDLH